MSPVVEFWLAGLYKRGRWFPARARKQNSPKIQKNLKIFVLIVNYCKPVYKGYSKSCTYTIGYSKSCTIFDVQNVIKFSRDVRAGDTFWNCVLVSTCPVLLSIQKALRFFEFKNVIKISLVVGGSCWIFKKPYDFRIRKHNWTFVRRHRSR